MDLLGRLFGSSERVKLLRLFILNPTAILSPEEIGKRTRVVNRTLRQELDLLKKIGFIEVKMVTLTPVSKGKKKVKPSKVKGWQLCQSFAVLHPLSALLRSDLVTRRREIATRLARAGQVKLLVIAGVFIDQGESRADLLIVGDHLKKRVVEKGVEALEAEIGRELSYASMDTAEFNYRYHACDKFVRDILDYPHERVVDKLKW